MAHLLQLQTFSSEKGNLSVFESVLPGDIQRVFYIYGVADEPRAGHRHIKAWNALMCVAGSCRVYVEDGETSTEYWLDSPEKCVVLEPKDWHIMDNFSKDAVLFVLSNELYDKEDYIYERYPAMSAVI
jgi:tellurite resistance-related uncharacterized protein